MDVVISHVAENDLEEIALYIARDSVTRALTFTDELQAKAKSLAGTPFKGAERNYLSAGLRLLPYRYYNIYYKVGDDVITVFRIMHSARDIGPEDFT